MTGAIARDYRSLTQCPRDLFDLEPGLAVLPGKSQSLILGGLMATLYWLPLQDCISTGEAALLTTQNTITDQ